MVEDIKNFIAPLGAVPIIAVIISIFRNIFAWKSWKIFFKDLFLTLAFGMLAGLACIEWFHMSQYGTLFIVSITSGYKDRVMEAIDSIIKKTPKIIENKISGGYYEEESFEDSEEVH